MKQLVSNDELMRQIKQTQDFIDRAVLSEDVKKSREHLEKLRATFIERSKTSIIEGWEEE